MNVPELRVLLADDRPEFAEAARMFLETQPYVQVVGSVQSGAQAVEAVRTMNPHVVLMDLYMPGMTGLEAMRAIKRANSHVRVVIVTLDDWPWQREVARAAGADGFISKSSFTESCRMLIAAWAGVLTEGDAVPLTTESIAQARAAQAAERAELTRRTGVRVGEDGQIVRGDDGRLTETHVPAAERLRPEPRTYIGVLDEALTFTRGTVS
jgi:DNA-binding NarL/FixJ family response regulator